MTAEFGEPHVDAGRSACVGRAAGAIDAVRFLLPLPGTQGRALG